MSLKTAQHWMKGLLPDAYFLTGRRSREEPEDVGERRATAFMIADGSRPAIPALRRANSRETEMQHQSTSANRIAGRDDRLGFAASSPPNGASAIRPSCGIGKPRGLNSCRSWRTTWRSGGWMLEALRLFARGEAKELLTLYETFMVTNNIIDSAEPGPGPARRAHQQRLHTRRALPASTAIGGPEPDGGHRHSNRKPWR